MIDSVAVFWLNERRFPEQKATTKAKEITGVLPPGVNPCWICLKMGITGGGGGGV